MNTNPETTSAINETIGAFVAAYAQRDLEAAMSFFSPEPDVTVIGAGAGEKRIGLEAIREQLEHDWSNAESISMELNDVRISSNETVAWIAADEIVHIQLVGHEVTYPMRLTAVLHQVGGKWLFTQWHASLPHTVQPEIT